MSTQLNILSLHSFDFSPQDQGLAALLTGVIRKENLDPQWSRDYIGQFQNTQLSAHTPFDYKDTDNKVWRVQGYSDPKRPGDLSRALVIYSEASKGEGGQIVLTPRDMVVGTNLNFAIFYAMTCCSSAAISCALGFERQGKFEVTTRDPAVGVKADMEKLFSPDKVRIVRAQPDEFDHAALHALGAGHQCHTHQASGPRKFVCN